MTQERTEAANVEPRTVSEWQRAIHALSKEKGWWDGEHDVPGKLALIHSELSEALECYRDGAMAVKLEPYRDNPKPEGFPIELADAVIRCLDLAEYLNFDLQGPLASNTLGRSTFENVQTAARFPAPGKTIPAKLYSIHGHIARVLEQGIRPDGFFALSDAVWCILCLCSELEIDLEEAIEMKHAYNQTRPYRHGGKRA